MARPIDHETPPRSSRSWRSPDAGDPEPWDAPWLNDTPPSRWSRASALVWWLLRVVVIALALTSAFISGLMLIRALWP